MRLWNSDPILRDRPVQKTSSTPLCLNVLIDIENSARDKGSPWILLKLKI